MSYLDLIEEEGINAQFMCVLSPRRQEDSFTLFSGSVYSKSFDYGYVTGVEINGEELTEANSSSLSAGEYYYDATSEILYLRQSDSTDPASDIVVVTYELYLATFDEHWYRDPLDDDSFEVYYEPLITKSPSLKVTTDDALFGYMPIQSASISFSNAPHIFEKHIYDSSFNRARIRLYHLLDDLELENIRLVYDGLCSDISYDRDTISVKTYNTVDELNTEYRNEDESFYSLAVFPNLDPNSKNKPIKFVFGKYDLIPTNISYVEPQTATTSSNRTWVCIGHQTNLLDLTLTVPASPSSTATRTYLPASHGIMVGDYVWLDRVVGTDAYVEVTAVGSNYIEHANVTSGLASGDSVKRGFVSRVTVVQANNVFHPVYGRDYLTSTGLAGGTSGIVFTNNFESNHSGMATLTNNDKIITRVYGPTNTVTLTGVGYGTNDSDCNNLSHPGPIIIELFKRVLGIPESRIDIPAFQTFLTDNTQALGICIGSEGSFPTVKKILQDIIQTSLIRFYINDDLKYSVTALKPMDVSADYDIDDNELLKNTFKASYAYGDILSEIIVKYSNKEALETPETSNDQKFSTVTATSNTALYLHKVKKQKTFDSLLFKEADAQTLASRFSYIFGDRRGSASIQCKNRFFLTNISERLDIISEKNPGFEFDEETLRTRSFSITGTQKSLRSIQLELDDQKGIEDNAGSW